MAKRHVIIELTHSQKLESAARAAVEGIETTFDVSMAPKLEGLELDPSFAAVSLPRLIRHAQPRGNVYDTTAEFDFDADPEVSTYLVRGTVDEEALPGLEAEVSRKRSVVGIYADGPMQAMIVCPGSPPVGTDATVESLLCTEKLHENGMDGKGVLVAIVDTGVNMAYLNSHGKHPTFDATRSWAWDPASVTPGSAPVSHGTMCAYDVTIAAPKATMVTS